jgi:predicted Zn finger-like uncharacterized protein
VFVSCDTCHVEYELDESKIPAGGARLRCTNCDHYFVISPPEASDLQSADDLAHDALASEDQGGADLDPGREAAPEGDFDPDGESDWEFNDEVAVSEPEVEEQAPEPDFDRDGAWGELSSAEDVVDDLLGSSGAIDADAATAVDDLLGEIDSVDLELDESSDDLQLDDSDDDFQLGESGGDLASGSEVPGEGFELDGEDPLEGSGGDPAADDGGSFEDPSDWDLFDAPAETDASAPSAGPRSRPDSAARDGALAEPRVEIAVSMADDSRPAMRWTDRIAEIAGWGAVLLMLIVALVGGFASNSSDARVPAGSWSGAGFEADQIAGRWVDNAVTGSIYVVSGRIRRAPGVDRASRKTLGIRLFDTTGEEIDRAPIPLTPAVPERILRESSSAELAAFQTRRAGRIAAVDTRWLSFEAVLTDLPRFASRFELQAIDR